MSIYEFKPLLIFSVVVAAVFGAVMGSFLNCTAWRVAHGESFLKGRSHCTSCGHTLGGTELIPILSWVFQRGKCRWCGEHVSVRYPLTELLFAMLTVLCLLKFDLTVLCLRNYIFLCCLFCLTLTDIDEMIIPDGCHVISAAAWLLALPFTFTTWGDIGTHLLAAVLFGGGVLGLSILMDKALGRETMGGGDIKLLAVAGLYLGLVGTLFALILSCLTGLVGSQLLRRKQMGQPFPFGPFIALGVTVFLLYGAPLTEWYLGLF